MNTSQTGWKIGIGAVVVVIVVVIIVAFAGHGSPSPSPENSGTAVTSSTPSTTASGVVSQNGTTPAANPSAGATNSNPAPKPPKLVIHLIAPMANSIWTIGKSNAITWDAAAGVTGEIDLINAQTKAFVGVVLSETGPNQTSFSWDARSIYLARYAADKQDVVPGTYSIRIRFDGNGLGSLVTAPIVIAQ